MDDWYDAVDSRNSIFLGACINSNEKGIVIVYQVLGMRFQSRHDKASLNHWVW
jgi:hypothetical protein